jgi:hypothetical protein
MKIGVLPFFDELYKLVLLFFENSTRKKFRFSLEYTFTDAVKLPTHSSLAAGGRLSLMMAANVEWITFGGCNLPNFYVFF